MERDSSWQAQTDSYLNGLNARICGNDYTATTLRTVRSLFALPNASNPDPRPVFAAINCISNSPNRQYREVLVNEFYAGGGAQDFSASIANWRSVLDSVQAPPPAITQARLNTNAFQFTVLAQRGRTNRVEGTTNLVIWSTITNIFGTNASVIVRDTNVFSTPRRSYRVVRE
jgi:hypothetical protein